MNQLKTYTFKTVIDSFSIDKNNLITNQAILNLLQKSASFHSSSFGYGVSNIPETHLAWVILNWKLRIFSRPKCNDEISICTWCNPIKKIYFYRDFEIRNNNNEIIGIASSKWILINKKNNTICRDFSEVKKNHGFFEKNVFGTEPFDKTLKAPVDFLNTIEYVVPRRDIDSNNHVNNVHYLDYAYEVLPQDIYDNSIFDNVEIMYKHEAKLNDSLHVSYSCIDNYHTISISNTASNILNCVIKLY